MQRYPSRKQGESSKWNNRLTRADRLRKLRNPASLEQLESRCLLAVTTTTPVPIVVNEGVVFNGNVMNFTANDAGPFTATINWDGTTSSAGVVTPSGGGFVVSGTHTYADDGTFTATVTITDTADATSVAPTTTATVHEVDLTGVGKSSPGRRASR